MNRIDTWQELGVWYAAERGSYDTDPIGEGETAEDAISNLERKVEDAEAYSRFLYEIRTEEA